MGRIPLRWTGWLVLSPAILVIGLIAARIAMEGDIIEDLNSLGVEVKDCSEYQKQTWMEKDGTALSVTYAGEQATEAGLRIGDVIFELDGRPIGKKNYFQLHQLKDTVRLSVKRNGINRTIKLAYNGFYRKLCSWVSSHLSPPYHVVFTGLPATKPPTVAEGYAAEQ